MRVPGSRVPADARRVLIALLVLATCALLVLATCALLPAHALADGDPGSDVLLDQSLFAGSDTNLSIAQQVRLGDLLNATAAVGDPVRVAIIAHPDDLGAITQLWDRPETYARYLGYELSNTYAERLLVVMPNGFGGLQYSADRDSPPSWVSSLKSLNVGGDSAADLVRATESAVYRIEAVAGVDKAMLAKHLSSSSPAASRAPSADSPAPATSSHPARSRAKRMGQGHPDVALIVAAVLLVAGYIAWREGRWPKRSSLGRLRAVVVRPGVLLPSALLVIVAGALVVNHNSSSGSGAPTATAALATNPNLDPGTALGAKVAPNFTLYDETGRRVSLSQYRGKVVILSFIDAECHTICPLTTTAMLDAKRSLGAAGKDVQLLGVDANWKSTQIDDVLTYSQLHGMLGHWHFLTGSLSQLNHIWTAYGVDEFKLAEKQRADMNLIDHVAATFMIAPDGRLAKLYTTVPWYGSIQQMGQLLAHEASELLPSHPRVSTKYSYANVPGISPTTTTRLRQVGGGTVTLGPRHPHMLVFFDTWDATDEIAARLDALNAYAKQAKREGLPPPVAIDEGTVEPSRHALPKFLETLPEPLDYPVAVDATGRVADGYSVEGEPWFVVTEPSGRTAWYREILSASKWPSNATLASEGRAALHGRSAATPGAKSSARELAGSPEPLAALHDQASKVVAGGEKALAARIKALRGYPIVVNVWGSWCAPCQAEFRLFAKASAQYGKRVAFLGADTEDTQAAGQQFLNQHHVSYPSYETSPTSLEEFLTGGLQGTPTTFYISRAGKVVYVNTGEYASQGSLDLDIADYALDGAGAPG